MEPGTTIEFLRQKLVKAGTVIERLRAAADLLDVCQNALSSPVRQNRYDVFHRVSYLLNEHVCDSEVWDWLQEVARSADLERQIDMRIAILELIPDPPVNWSNLFRLWDMWFDPETRWAVYIAYKPFPRRIHQHLRRYVALRRRLGLPIPELLYEEFQTALQAHSV